jgi:hypothetical protein
LVVHGTAEGRKSQNAKAKRRQGVLFQGAGSGEVWLEMMLDRSEREPGLWRNR